MTINTKFNLGQKVIYDIDKIGIIIGLEIITRDTFYQIPQVKYKLKATNIENQILLQNKKKLKYKNNIKLINI